MGDVPVVQPGHVRGQGDAGNPAIRLHGPVRPGRGVLERLVAEKEAGRSHHRGLNPVHSLKPAVVGPLDEGGHVGRAREGALCIRLVDVGDVQVHAAGESEAQGRADCQGGSTGEEHRGAHDGLREFRGNLAGNPHRPPSFSPHLGITQSSPGGSQRTFATQMSLSFRSTVRYSRSGPTLMKWAWSRGSS